MTTWIAARSISRAVKQQLAKGPFTARVLGTFERACDLVTPNGDVLALVFAQLGNGPLNIVVDGAAGLFSEINLDTPVTLNREQLRLGGLRINLSGASVWEPRPDWDTLRGRYATLASHLPLLRALGLRHAPADTFLALLDSSSSGDKLAGTIFSTAQKAGESLREGWSGNQQRLQEAGMTLAGLGSGLTPAGDDFLTGAMLWAWLAHPDPDSFCNTLLQSATPRTTTLSAAFLRAAARGECSGSWHTLLAAVGEGTEVEIAATVQGVLAHGATSGADTLAGFLYLTQVATWHPQ